MSNIKVIMTIPRKAVNSLIGSFRRDIHPEAKPLPLLLELFDLPKGVFESLGRLDL
jgi:hypothetical protein